MLSVVMAVHNGGDSLRASIDSVLRQQDVDFEFIIVNDGSTDGGPEILDEYRKSDKRIHVIEQENHGLTRALIKGCEAAKGDFVARQDAGDISLSWRFSKQIEVLQERSDVVLVSCGTRFVGPGGEKLYDVVQTEQELNDSLGVLSVDGMRGPSSHPSVMFRRSDYEAVGGYRSQFRVAQDMDLWTRLVERGSFATLPEVLYVAEYSAGGISSTNRQLQLAVLEQIVDCTRLRRAGQPEKPALDKAACLEIPKRGPFLRRLTRSKFYYFIGSCLRHEEPVTSRHFYKLSIRCNPLNLKASARLLEGLVKSAFGARWTSVFKVIRSGRNGGNTEC